MLRDAFEVLEQVKNAKGSKAKLQILKDNQSEEMKFVLDTFLNPFNTYGVVEYDDKQIYNEDAPDMETVIALRQTLMDRELTGNAAKSALRNVTLCKDDFMRGWLILMFKKHLTIGIQATSINKVYPKLIPTFDIGLCSKYEGNADIFKGREWLMEPKFDGMRCVTFIDSKGTISMLSRNAMPMYNTELIEEEIRSCRLVDCVLDGEIMGDSWNSTISAMHSKDKPDSDVIVRYNIFDIIPMKDWVSRKTATLQQRKELLSRLFEDATDTFTYLKYVPGVLVRAFSYAEVVYQAYLAEGYEGTVLKDLESQYQFGRGDVWLKWKPVTTYDLKVVGVEEGTGRNLGRLGALVCKYKDGTVNVGSGYSDEMRDIIWAMGDDIIGKIIEMKAQSETKDGSLLFPRFVRLRDDKDAPNES